ncbi:hypothetical protein GCM10023165_06960 [Variovorax defluvii]|uniref:EamA-like transporter family protein n=1 Tax=Variovorax defluvii TaxID=913761 RepID=A0ABP8GZW2_9BURK
MAISYAGVMLVFGHELSLGQSASAAWGTLLIFLSAVSYAIIGPLSTIVLSALILGEPLTAWVAAGTALVIAGIFVFTRMGR